MTIWIFYFPAKTLTLSFLIHTLLKIQGTFSCPNLFWTYRRTLFHRSQLNNKYTLETIHILRQQKEWFRNWQFLLAFNLFILDLCWIADISSGCVRKSQKMCWHHIWMVPYLPNLWPKRHKSKRRRRQYILSCSVLAPA